MLNFLLVIPIYGTVAFHEETYIAPMFHRPPDTNTASNMFHGKRNLGVLFLIEKDDEVRVQPAFHRTNGI